SLTSQRQRKHIAAARKAADAFLSQLDPVLQKYLLDRQPLTIVEAREVWLLVSKEREQQAVAAKHEFERLLSQIPEEWSRYCKRQPRGFKILAEFRIRGQITRR